MEFLHLADLKVNTSSLEDMRAVPLITAADNLKEYYTPILVCFGMAGNVMTMLTITRSQLHRLHYTAYILALVMVDTCFLCVLLVVWMQSRGLDLYNIPGWCQGLTMTGYTCEFLAVWYVAGLTLETLMTLLYPVGTGVWWPAWRPRILTVAITTAAIVIYLNISLLFGVARTTDGRGRCMPLRQFLRTVRVLNEVDMFFNFILSYLFIIIVLTLVIIKAILIVRCKRLLIKKRTNGSTDACHVTWGLDTRDDTQITMVKLTTTLALLFLLGGIPTHSLRIWFTVIGYTDSDERRPINLSQVAVHHMLLQVFFTRCALTFPACFVSWPSFRSSFCQLLKCWSSRADTTNGNNIEITEMETEFESNIERE